MDFLEALVYYITLVLFCVITSLVVQVIKQPAILQDPIFQFEALICPALLIFHISCILKIRAKDE